MIFFLLYGFISISNAALVSRLGGQAYYDTALNITWLTNANLAASETFGVSGIQVDGGMSWFTAHDWLNAMNSNNYLGANNWRMPTFEPINGIAINYDYTNDGTSDYGNNIGAPDTLYEGSTANEMAYMYYTNLNGVNLYDIYGTQNTTWGLPDTEPFANLITDGNHINGQYWTGVTFGEVSLESAFDFYFDHGGQGGTQKLSTWNFVWAVSDGDIGASVVPVPAAVWLFGSGLVGLVGFARRKKA